jgi:hypothetical protein
VQVPSRDGPDATVALELSQSVECIQEVRFTFREDRWTALAVFCVTVKSAAAGIVLGIKYELDVVQRLRSTL